jgi:hypothetical protein
MCNPSSARSRNHQRVVHQQTVLTPQVGRSKQRAHIQRQDVHTHQRNPFDERTVAIKILPESLASDPLFRGAVLYEMLTGQRVFAGEDVSDITRPWAAE